MTAALDDATLDLAFLDRQVNGDRALERDVLRLFLEQLDRLLPGFATAPTADQDIDAHLLRGSCQGIGAFGPADRLQAWSALPPDGRSAALAGLRRDFEPLRRAVAARLAAP